MTWLANIEVQGLGRLLARRMGFGSQTLANDVRLLHQFEKTPAVVERQGETFVSIGKFHLKNQQSTIE